MEAAKLQDFTVNNYFHQKCVGNRYHFMSIYVVLGIFILFLWFLNALFITYASLSWFFNVIFSI